jgi:magnesium transporter
MAPTSVYKTLDGPIAPHMRTSLARLYVDQTIAEALAEIRRSPPEGRIIYFYVTDSADRLKGVVPTRRLLLNSPETKIADIMVKDVVALPATATVLDACEFFTMHRLLAFPVVDAERRLLGAVDVELYTGELSDIERSERSDDFFQVIGVHLVEAQHGSPLAAFRQRFSWLLCNIAGGVLAAFLLGIFRGELEKAVALALFIPVVLALAEGVSIQSVSLALQVLHSRQPTMGTILGRLRREAVTGLLLGAASALVVGAVAFLWLGDLRVVLCLFGAIGGGVVAAAVIGVALANLLRFFRRDPKVAAGPIALAVSDMVTLLVYFNLARWLVA